MSRRIVYWDAAAFIAVLKPEKDRRDDCKVTLDAAERGELIIVTSAVTLVEVVHLDGREVLDKKKEAKIKAFFENDYIDIWAAGRFQTEQARTLLWKYPAIKYKDAIHLATAIECKAEELNTFDEYLLKLTDKEGSPSLPLTICKPGRNLQKELEFPDEQGVTEEAGAEGEAAGDQGSAEGTGPDAEREVTAQEEEGEEAEVAVAAADPPKDPPATKKKPKDEAPPVEDEDDDQPTATT